MDNKSFSQSDLSELANFFKQQRQEQVQAQKQQESNQIGAAGIQAGANLLAGLMQQKAQNELNAQQLQSELIKRKTESDVENIAKSGELQREAFAKLMANYRAALV